MTIQSDLDRQARDILRGNDRGGYTVPTAGLYPYQWNWDSAICAFGFATFDVPRAWSELESLLSGQWDNGMVPHILFHKPDPGYFPGPDVWQGIGPIPSSGITQPAVAGSMVRLVYERDPDAGREVATRLYPKLRAWHRWFLDWRLDSRGAVCSTHPWEAGRDNTPEWDRQMERINPEGVGEYTRRDTGHVDPSMRPTKFDYDRYIWLVQLGARLQWDPAALNAASPFRMADPTMTFLLLRAHRDVLWLGEALDLETDGLTDEIAQLEKGADSLWNPVLASFDGRDAFDGSFAGCISNASYLCWWAGVGRPEQAKHYAKVMEQVQYGLPSYQPDGPHFDSRRYWRGPTWAFINMLAGMGLAEAGLTKEAALLRETTRALIAENGFAEYFDPLDGSPAGGKSFSWTAATWLAWASPSAEEA